MYKSVIAGMKNNTSYTNLITEYSNKDSPAIHKEKDYHWELVINSCMAEMLRMQFKKTSLDKYQLIDQLEE